MLYVDTVSSNGDRLVGSFLGFALPVASRSASSGGTRSSSGGGFADSGCTSASVANGGSE
eukprot:6975316-Prymnesium_polylepis.1